MPNNRYLTFRDNTRPGALLYRAVVDRTLNQNKLIADTEQRCPGLVFKGSGPTDDPVSHLQLWLRGNCLAEVPNSADPVPAPIIPTELADRLANLQRVMNVHKFSATPTLVNNWQLELLNIEQRLRSIPVVEQKTMTIDLSPALPVSVAEQALAAKLVSIKRTTGAYGELCEAAAHATTDLIRSVINEESKS